MMSRWSQLPFLMGSFCAVLCALVVLLFVPLSDEKEPKTDNDKGGGGGQANGKHGNLKPDWAGTAEAKADVHGTDGGEARPEDVEGGQGGDEKKSHMAMAAPQDDALRAP